MTSNINKENQFTFNETMLATNFHYPESINGILICGYNWGGSPKKGEKAEYLNYFSDKSKDYWEFRNRILKWFKLFGHPLEEYKNKIDHFEKSISYTNWLQSKSKTFSLGENLIEKRFDFITVCKKIKPKIIFFFGKKLIFAFCNQIVLNEIKNITGDLITGPKEFPERKCNFKKFIITHAHFENCDVICFPHPTGSRGLNDAYIELFKNEVGEIINNYKININ